MLKLYCKQLICCTLTTMAMACQRWFPLKAKCYKLLCAWQLTSYAMSEQTRSCLRIKPLEGFIEASGTQPALVMFWFRQPQMVNETIKDPGIKLNN